MPSNFLIGTMSIFANEKVNYANLISHHIIETATYPVNRSVASDLYSINLFSAQFIVFAGRKSLADFR